MIDAMSIDEEDMRIIKKLADAAVAETESRSRMRQA